VTTAERNAAAATLLENFESAQELSVASLLQAIFDSKITGAVSLTLHCNQGVPTAVDIGPPVRLQLASAPLE
jgi:hypothetical protein